MCSMGGTTVDQKVLGYLRRYVDVLHGRDGASGGASGGVSGSGSGEVGASGNVNADDDNANSTSDKVPKWTDAAFTTPQCGLEVHIGLPSSQPIPLPVLKHLPSHYAGSNKTEFVEGRHGPGCPLQSDRAGNGKGFNLVEARKQIFEKGMTINRLAGMMDADGGDVPAELVWGNEVGADKNPLPLAGSRTAEERARDSAGSERSGWNTVDTSAVDGGSILSEAEAEGPTLRLDSLHVAAQQQNKREASAQENAASEQLTRLRLDESNVSDSNELSSPNIQRFATCNKHKITRWNLLDRHPS